jgi:hypothetical protein
VAVRIFQHWVGEMLVEASDLPAAAHPVDEWFPSKPTGATLVAKDDYPEPTDLFEDVIRLRGKVGPIRFRASVDIAFSGTVEYWRVGDEP